MHVKGLLFDLDDTLLDRHAIMTGIMAAWLRQHHPQMTEASHRAALLQLQAWDREHEEPVVFAERWLATWPAADARLSALEHWQSVRQQLLAGVAADPAIHGMLARLAKRYRLALVTNGGSETQRIKIARCGLAACFLESCIFVSEEVGSKKPHRRIFELAVAALELKPSECLFIGNNPLCDVDGARQAGLRSCWVRRGECYPDHLAAPGLIVEHVLELEACLDG